MVDRLEVCVNEIRAKQEAYVPPERERCKYSCSNEVRITCPDYRPMNRYRPPSNGNTDIR